MVIDSDLPPVPQVSFDDLLLECIDALKNPSVDGDQREAHIMCLNKAAVAPDVSEELQDTLKKVAETFRNGRGCNLLSCLLSPNDHGESLAATLAKELGQVASRYVYHGTIYGRLAKIAQEGLVPGRYKVWKDDFVPRSHCDSAVFFTSTWRGAAQWAEVAQAHSSSKKDKYRTPVIIRVATSGLALGPDPRAAAPGCLMVRSSVPLADPHVILGKLSGFPNWRPLAEVLATT